MDVAPSISGIKAWRFGILLRGVIVVRAEVAHNESAAPASFHNSRRPEKLVAGGVAHLGRHQLFNRPGRTSCQPTVTPKKRRAALPSLPPSFLPSLSLPCGSALGQVLSTQPQHQPGSSADRDLYYDYMSYVKKAGRQPKSFSRRRISTIVPPLASSNISRFCHVARDTSYFTPYQPHPRAYI